MLADPCIKHASYDHYLAWFTQLYHVHIYVALTLYNALLLLTNNKKRWELLAVRKMMLRTLKKLLHFLVTPHLSFIIFFFFTAVVAVTLLSTYLIVAIMEIFWMLIPCLGRRDLYYVTAPKEASRNTDFLRARISRDHVDASSVHVDRRWDRIGRLGLVWPRAHFKSHTHIRVSLNLYTEFNFSI